MRTKGKAVWDLEPGDEYLVGLLGGARASRVVLEVLQRTPMNGALLWVRGDDGNAFRSHMSGTVQVIVD